MSWGHRRSTLLCVLAAAILVGGGKAALAAVEELPFRQRISDCVAVLRHLYKSRLDYADKLKMLQYNINTTETQFQTVHGLYEAEMRQAEPDVMKLARYEGTMNTLIEQFHQFAAERYYEALKKLKATLEEASARLEKSPGAAEALAEATPATPVTPAPPPATPAAEAAPLAPPTTAGGLEGAAKELETLTAPMIATAPPAAGETAPVIGAAPVPAEAPALNPIQRTIAELQKSIETLKTKIDSFNATNYIAYNKLFTQHMTEVDGELAYYQSVLNARVAEYRALFGNEPPVNLSYKAEIERLHPASKIPGLLVVE